MHKIDLSRSVSVYHAGERGTEAEFLRPARATPLKWAVRAVYGKPYTERWEDKGTSDNCDVRYDGQRTRGKLLGWGLK